MKTTQNFYKWLLQLNVHTSLDARHYIDCNTDLDASEIENAEIGSTMLMIFNDKQQQSTESVYTKDLRRLYRKKYEAFRAEDYRKFDNLDRQMHEILTKLSGINNYDAAYSFLANIIKYKI